MNPGDLKQEWNERAYAAQDSLQGVLFKNFPFNANRILHEWHAWLVREIFAPNIPNAGSVLDLGCGYGRLSDVLQDCRHDLKVMGQDISEQYCEMYRSKGRVAVSADQASLPFEDSSFNAVFSVTSLMYSHGKIDAVLSEVHRVLKPGGLLLIVDPGEEINQLIRTVRKSEISSGPLGKGFGMNDYLDLLVVAGFSISSKGGNPFFSTCALATLGKFKPIGFIDALSKLDARPSGYWKYALHRWVTARAVKTGLPHD